MAEKIKFKIVTPERTVFEEEIDQATLPVENGEVTILPNHRSYIASLKAGGEIVLKKSGEEISLAVAGGFIEFANNNLVVLADRAERAEEIDLKRAEEARVRAEALMKEKIVDSGEYARVAAAIEKEMARIKVARKHHTKRGIKID